MTPRAFAFRGFEGESRCSVPDRRAQAKIRRGAVARLVPKGGWMTPRAFAFRGFGDESRCTVSERSGRDAVAQRYRSLRRRGLFEP